ncbi:unnamed protein product, partial [Meganyctiphanes norvegica]
MQYTNHKKNLKCQAQFLVQKMFIRLGGFKLSSCKTYIEAMPCKVDLKGHPRSLESVSNKDFGKLIEKEGQADTAPGKGSCVTINATGKLEDGTIIEKHEDLTFTLGDNEVIQGFEMILPLMNKGEIAEGYIASRFAYGKKGLSPKILPDTNIYYTIELVDYHAEQDPGEISVSERMVIGNRKRERGNFWFNREEYTMAIQCYSACLDFFDDAEEEYGEEVRDEVKPILEERLKALNNLAATQIKLESYDVAVRSLDTILKCQPENVKALYRKGKCLGVQGKYKEAEELLRKACSLEPASRLLHQELAKVRERVREEAESQKSLYRRMLGLKNEPKANPKKGSANEQNYPVLTSFHMKTWVMSFLTLFTILMVYKYFYPMWLESQGGQVGIEKSEPKDPIVETLLPTKTPRETVFGEKEL